MLAVLLPQSLVWTICVLLAGVLYRFAVWQIISLTGLVVIGLSMATITVVGLAAVTMNFKKQSVPPGTGVLMLAANLGWVLGLLMLFSSMVWHGSTGTDARSVLETLSPDLFDSLWLPGFMLILMLTGVALLSWWQGVRRLGQWQVTD